MMMRAIPILAVLALCAATAYEIVHPPTPRLIYNKSASAPIGWYRLYPEGAITRGAKVAAFAPAQARKLGAERGYLPEHVPLIKSVWAMGGDRICSVNGLITAPNRPDVHAAVQDGLGRGMPQIKGCFILQADEVFLISTDVQTSWDSRYFGAVSTSQILGTVYYLGDRQGDQVVSGGWARVSGVERKIKGNSAPWAVSHCLHIFFRGAPLMIKSAPIWSRSQAELEVMGGAPYPHYHSGSRKPSP